MPGTEKANLVYYRQTFVLIFGIQIVTLSVLWLLLSSVIVRHCHVFIIGQSGIFCHWTSSVEPRCIRTPLIRSYCTAISSSVEKDFMKILKHLHPVTPHSAVVEWLAGSRDSHMALWRIVDDNDGSLVSPSSVAGCQSYTHWTAGLHNSSSDDDDDDVDLSRDSDWEPMTKRLATTTQRGRRQRHRPLHVPSYYRMRPMCVKPCEKAEKVRAFAYNNNRQVTALISEWSSLLFYLMSLSSFNDIKYRHAQRLIMANRNGTCILTDVKALNNDIKWHRDYC